MNKLICLSLLSTLVFTGCATTQKLVSQVSGGSDTPIAQVLNERSDLRKNLSTVELRQYFNQVENPTVAEVKLTETGLMDDSVKSIRSIYRFKNVDGQWQRIDKTQEYQCLRGKNTKTFQTAKCP
ncbi:hypothetical protein FW754_11915 [Acinetobacter sp. 1207_04]|uniref:hypothetical protein n=1 Tax=Acinetobacter sp. 1207_04 TaxID=2604449 RepID=UPI004057F3B4